MTPPSIAVVGSANVDLVVLIDRLPRPGETLSGATFARYPGGKGANQAVAAARLGADVVFTGAVGRDPFVEEALAGLREAEVVLRVVERDAPTGVALIEVADGETTIVVAPGANAELEAGDVDVSDADAVLCQLEIPDDVVRAAAEQARFLCLNAAPARRIDVEPDLLVVNRLEHEVVGDLGMLTAVTLGAEGAILLERGRRWRAPLRRPSMPSTERPPAMRSRRACSWRCSRDGRARSAAPCVRSRSDRRVTARRSTFVADGGGGRGDPR